MAEAWAECEGLYARAPEDRGSFACLRNLGKRFPDELDAVEARLVDLRGAHPENPWLPYYQASIRWRERRIEVPRLYQEAAELAGAAGDIAAEAEIRRRRAQYLLQRLGEIEEARRELSRLGALAASSGEPLVRIELQVATARALTLLFGDLEKALHLLYSVERDGDLEACRSGRAGAEGCLRAERDWLAQMATTTHSLGLLAEEERYLRRLDELTPRDDRSRRAALAFRWAAYHASGSPTEKTAAKVREYAREALDLVGAENRSVLLHAHLLLGRVAGSEGRQEHLDRCLELTGERVEGIRLDCLAAKAELEAASDDPDPARIRAWLEEARQLAGGARDPWSHLTLRQARARVHWSLGDHAEGRLEGEELLRAIERQYAAQPTGSGRAQIRSGWSEVFHWMAGRLLEEGPGQDLEAAFRILERARARTLLEARSAAARDLPSDTAGRLADLERRRADLQIRLWSPDAGPKDEELEAELREVEKSVEAVWHGVEAGRPRPSSASPVASLAEVEAMLGDDEAMLVFQSSAERDLFGRPAGGSWVVVSTRTGSRAFRLPDKLTLGPRLRLFSRPGYPEIPELWRQLHGALLADALRALPEGVSRLVLLPDGDLQQVPFELLAAPGGLPLADRFQISYAPSATLWLEWRRGRPRPAEAPALVLADPEFGPAGELAGREFGLFRSGPRQPLAKAEEEGEHIVRRLAGGSRLLLGPEASEDALFHLDLSRFALLHFASHASSDADLPHRSAIFLAAGSAEKDGLLQPHEIATLDLEGRLVVLGTCEGGAGLALPGEGTLSLARAFFAAGARTVVASRRPLRDGEAARFFEVFYDHLAGGRSVGEAVATAQRARRRAGDPDHSWSALATFGDAGLVPFAHGLGRPLDRWRHLVARAAPWVVLALLAVVLGWQGRRRLTRGAP
ncbi:MAG: CHAT domain-containing protein [Holophagales bacterium]|nr:CHAT domain-containing protein [Holophagales bacterium]